jgi:2-keto-4-pentenoate hydratase/2-oxohepta-3-ene-1,7-dioic acid hydratase in catechol pathway
MRLVRYRHVGLTRIGVEVPGGVLPSRHSDLRMLIEAGPEELAALRHAAERPDRAEIIQPERLLAPIAERCQLLFAGGNYRDHLAEAGLQPKEPVFFPKLYSAVIGPGEPIRIPTPETHTDWEAELAIVIGRTAYQVSSEHALGYIFGYTLVNDVSARDVMDREPLQIMLCKSPDSFCPIGPHVVTADEMPDIKEVALELTTWLNGELKQHARTDQMIYTIPTLLEFLTRTVTLAPGDVVSTGTAGGTGMGATPPQFMAPGDEIVVAMTGIGELRNPVVAGWSNLH